MNIFFGVRFNVFADEGHPEGTPHNEAVSIDPLTLLVIIGVILVVGFVVWKFALRSPKSPSSSSTQPTSNPQTEQKTVSQNNEKKSS